MNDLDEILSQCAETIDIVEEADRTRAYIRITQTLGPSPQLTAFVNYDQSIKSDDGAGLESLSVDDQHFFILSKLNPDMLDAMALESVRANVKKVVGAVLASHGLGGIKMLVELARAGLPVPAQITTIATGLSIALIVGGSLLIGSGIEDDAVVAHSSFEKDVMPMADTAVRASGLFASSIPSNLDEKSWKSFHDNFIGDKDSIGFLGSLKNLLKGGGSTNHGTPQIKSGDVKKNLLFSKSGWDAEKFKQAVAWYAKNEETLVHHKKQIAEKLTDVEHQLGQYKGDLGKTLVYISHTVAVASRALHAADKNQAVARKLLDRVGRHFKEKK